MKTIILITLGSVVLLLSVILITIGILALIDWAIYRTDRGVEDGMYRIYKEEVTEEKEEK